MIQRGDIEHLQHPCTPADEEQTEALRRHLNARLLECMYMHPCAREVGNHAHEYHELWRVQKWKIDSSVLWHFVIRQYPP